MNALKDLGKTVTIIGHADKVSEHLMLSADEFVSVRELLDSDGETVIPSSPELERPTEEILSPQITAMAYSDAVDCLLEAVGQQLNRAKVLGLKPLGD